MKVWERRLMKDFKLAPVATEEEIETLMSEPPPENEDSISKYVKLSGYPKIVISYFAFQV